MKKMTTQMMTGVCGGAIAGKLNDIAATGMSTTVGSGIYTPDGNDLSWSGTGGQGSWPGPCGGMGGPMCP